jgi:hypothetical protein
MTFSQKHNSGSAPKRLPLKFEACAYLLGLPCDHFE